MEEFKLPRKWKQVIVIVAITYASMVAAYLLFLNVRISGPFSQRGVLAKITHFSNEVKRKAAAEFEWVAVREDEALHRKDVVEVGPDSSATIVFLNGTEIEVGANTRIIIDDIGKFSKTQLRGTVIVLGDLEDRKITIDKSGSVESKTHFVRLVKPFSHAHYFVRGENKSDVEFSWKALQVEKELRNKLYFEISADENFPPKKTTRKKLADGEQTQKRKLKEGKYFWRISSGNQSLSSTRRLSLSRAADIAPLTPNSKRTVLDRGTPIRFYWKLGKQSSVASLSAIASHQIQVSRDADFENLVRTLPISVSSKEVFMEELPEGKIHWRILSKYPNLTVASKSHSVLIGKQRRVNISLLKPKNRKKILDVPSIQFKWNGEEEGISFRWEIEDVREKGLSIAKVENLSNGFKWRNPQPGSYRWRVAAMFHEHVLSTSRWFRFTIEETDPVQLTGPSHGFAYFFANAPPVFKFTWNKHPFLKDLGRTFEFQIGKTPTLSSPIKEIKTTKTEVYSSKIKMEDGIYYWRVRIKNLQNEVLKTSKSRAFGYGYFPKLRGLASETRHPSAVFTLLEFKASLLASWDPEPGVASYHVAVQKGKRVLKETIVEEPNVDLQLLEPGIYLIFVRTLDANKIPGKFLSLGNFRTDKRD